MKKLNRLFTVVSVMAVLLSASLNVLADEIYVPVDGPGMIKENSGICWIIGVAVVVVAVAAIFIIRAAKKKKK